MSTLVAEGDLARTRSTNFRAIYGDAFKRYVRFYDLLTPDPCSAIVQGDPAEIPLGPYTVTAFAVGADPSIGAIPMSASLFINGQAGLQPSVMLLEAAPGNITRAYDNGGLGEITYQVQSGVAGAQHTELKGRIYVDRIHGDI